jgi:uncharacterized damage-inducible protein DinB
LTKKTFDALWDQVRQQYGVYLRLLESIPNERYQSRPFQGMRSAAELVAHVSGGIVRNIALGVAGGEIKSNPAAETTTAEGFRSSADAVAFARRCWKEADTAASTIGEAQLDGMVRAWGSTFPGATLIHVLKDELLHHRGQLYVYARAAGGEPPFVWSHDQNAPEFAPKT